MKSKRMKKTCLVFLVSCFTCLPVNASTLPDPVAWWKLDETEGIIAEDYIGDANGILVNGPNWATGIIDGALSFNGSDDYVEVPGYKGITGTSARTCTAWIKVSSQQHGGSILSWGTEQTGQKWILRIGPEGTLSVGIGSGYKASIATVNNGQWHHAAAVLIDDGSPKASEIQLYIDGFIQNNTVTLEQSIDTGIGQNVMIGAYENAGVPAVHFEGLIDDVRIYDNALGEDDILQLAEEFFPSMVWVDDDYTEGGDNDGHVWGYDAFNTIQEGIYIVLSGGTVRVASGTYTENVILKNAIRLIGAGTETTVIDGNQNGSVITALHCVSNTRLSGFRLINGSSGDGAGIYSSSSNLTITDCVFKENYTSVMGMGGGVYNEESELVISNCSFISNYSGGTGGAIYTTTSNVFIVNSRFLGNYASSSGGAIYNKDTGDIIASNCIFSGNTASSDSGGAIKHRGGTLVLTNSIFYGNSAEYTGSAIYGRNYYPTVWYSIQLKNCILWNNTGGFVIQSDDEKALLSSSNYQGFRDPSIPGKGAYCFDGGGNIDVDPLFVDPDGDDDVLGTEDDDFRLAPDSPCIDAGHNGYFMDDILDFDNDDIFTEALPVDLDGNDRYMDDVDVTDTGASPVAGWPIVDMGPYEFTGRAAIEGDLNHDWVVNMLDQVILAENWLEDRRVP